MESRWSNKEANEFVRRYAEKGVAADLALRVYTSRLLGAEPRLVQHGGGNTSVKTRMKDVVGSEVDVICVKGSGWDLEFIEPAGLPALRLKPLLALRSAKKLSDEQMVNEQRSAMLDASGPNPSVETLLHAWLPHVVIDHTHSNAILSLTDQTDGDAICREIFGDRLAIAPYCMPGFDLAHLAADTFERAKSTEGMILLKHGIFTWGETAQESYEGMIAFVSEAEARIAKARTAHRVARPAPSHQAVAEVAPVLRGALSRRAASGRRFVLEWRGSTEVLGYIAGKDVQRYSQTGVVTPDHVIRTKPWPLLLADTQDAAAVEKAVSDYVVRYRDYFDRWNSSSATKKKPLDPVPRVLLVPDVGLFGVGASQAEARIVADIAETTISVIGDAERVGRFAPITEQEIFEMEHWSLEQAKLRKDAPKSLAGAVVVVTGGGGTIGGATAQAFAAQGAAVAVLDVDGDAAEKVAKAVKGAAFVCNVTSKPSVDAAFVEVARMFGGVDIVVSNAGAAWQGQIGVVEEKLLHESLELNFFGHQRVAQAALRIMRAQRMGGCLLFNASKQALNPGAGFGPYGVAKAAALFLARQYAVDHGHEGIRSNAVNADRIRSGLLTDEMIAQRSAARGVSEAEYMGGNLLGLEVTPADVADAFVLLALAEKTTGAILTVDGGNIAAAPR
jgi:rhamnose utilization protein RhaD (predicted bifunctional aldolase and dehydrogenase)/NAD(P)-dependent dehydrogenase (short-subunit alcohol dehydrogenase family)